MESFASMIDSTKQEGRPPRRWGEIIKGEVGRRIPMTVKRNLINPLLYSLPFLRTRTISCEELTATFFARNKTERFFLGIPDDEGSVGLELLEVFKRQQSTGHFLDIGAEHGMYSMFALSAGLQVTAFEPDPMRFDLLGNNTSLNQKHVGQIQLIDAALGDQETSAILFSDGFKAACPSLRRTGNQKTQIAVNLFRLDDLIQQGLISPPTIVKIDVEGAEDSIIAGAMEFLSGPQAPGDLFIEIHPVCLPLFDTTPQIIWDRVLSCGYGAKNAIAKGNELLVHFTK